MITVTERAKELFKQIVILFAVVFPGTFKCQSLPLQGTAHNNNQFELECLQFETCDRRADRTEQKNASQPFIRARRVREIRSHCVPTPLRAHFLIGFSRPHRHDNKANPKRRGSSLGGGVAKSTSPVLGVHQWNILFIMSAYHADYEVIKSTQGILISLHTSVTL